MGKVYLVGAGPGAADLLTLRAARLLLQADVVFFDALVDSEVLQLAPRAKKIAVGKRAGRVSTEQRFINRALVEAGLRHDIVVRLKGGDPMLFGRAQEEIDALKAAGVEVEIVPGVTAALAGAASLGVSLTRRGMARNVAFVTPRAAAGAQRGDWARTVAAADTAILYMAAHESCNVSAELMRYGMSPATPALLIENVSLPGERTVFTSLAGLAEAAGSARFAGPTLVCLGAVFASSETRAAPEPLAALAGNPRG